MNKKHIRFDVDSDLHRDFKSKLAQEGKKLSEVMRQLMVDYIDTHYDIEKVDEYGIVFTGDNRCFPSSISEMKEEFKHEDELECFVFKHGKMVRYK